MKYFVIAENVFIKISIGMFENHLGLVYIGEPRLDFIYGKTYKAIYFTTDLTTFLDKDYLPVEFPNHLIHLNFIHRDEWREERLEKLGI